MVGRGQPPKHRASQKFVSSFRSMGWTFSSTGARCDWSEFTESSKPNMSSLKLPKVGLDEIKTKKVAFGKELAAEFLGTMLLVVIGCGSAMSGDNDDGEGQLGMVHVIM